MAYVKSVKRQYDFFLQALLLTRVEGLKLIKSQRHVQKWAYVIYSLCYIIDIHRLIVCQKSSFVTIFLSEIINNYHIHFWLCILCFLKNLKKLLRQLFKEGDVYALCKAPKLHREEYFVEFVIRFSI